MTTTAMYYASRIGTSLIALLVVGATIEVGFRVASTDPWYERLEREQNRRPWPRKLVGGERFAVREPLPEGERPPDALRILFLGDSFTYGSGVSDPSAVFPSLVSRTLQERLPAGAGVRVESFNAGVPGSLTGRWVRLLALAQPIYQPDLVVAVFFLRDGAKRLGGSRAVIRRIGEEMAALAERSWLYRNLRTYRYFRQKRVQRELSAAYLSEMRSAYLGSAEQTAEWREAQRNLLELRERTEAQGAAFVLVIFPLLFALGPDYPLEDVCEEIERFARAQGMQTLSLLPSFRGRDAASLWVSEVDQHPNREGHRIAAAAVAEYLAPIVADRVAGR